MGHEWDLAFLDRMRKAAEAEEHTMPEQEQQPENVTDAPIVNLFRGPWWIVEGNRDRIIKGLKEQLAGAVEAAKETSVQLQAATVEHRKACVNVKRLQRLLDALQLFDREDTDDGETAF